MTKRDWREFNLVTLNAFGVPSGRTRARLRTIARELDHHSLHAVFLQEVQLHRYVPLLVNAFTTFPHATWEPHLYAPKGGLLTLTDTPQRGASFVPFSERGWFLGPTLADRMLHKGMLLCHIEHGGVPITLINTHLAANYSGSWARTNRYAQLEAAQLRELAEMVNQQPRDHVVVVAGDFNIPRYSWLYEEFLSRTGLQDPLGEVEEPTYRPNGMLPDAVASALSVAIDHALVRLPEGLDARYHSSIILRDKVPLVDGRHAHLSDHYGIHLRLEWPRHVGGVNGAATRSDTRVITRQAAPEVARR